MRLVLHALAAFAALSAAGCIPMRVHAQPSQRPGDVTLQLHVAQPGSVASVERPVRGAAPALVLRCDSFCSAELPRGRYRLLLEATDRTSPGSTSIRLVEPARFISRPAQPAALHVGVLMLGAGAIVAISGVASLVYSFMSQMCHGVECAAPPKYFWYGVAATPSGSVLAVAGWLIFSSAQRVFDREPLARRETHLKIALAPTAHGASALLVGAL